MKPGQMAGWFDSPIESFKAAVNDALAQWSGALADLDTAYAEFNVNRDFAHEDADLSPRWNDLDGKVAVVEGTIQSVGNAITSIQDFFKSIGSAVGSAVGLSGMGLLPVVPWALVGLVTAGVAAIYVLVNALRQFNVDVTNKRIAEKNIELVSQGLDPLPYMGAAEAGTGGGLFAGLPETAKWIAYAAIAYFAYELLKGNRRGHA